MIPQYTHAGGASGGSRPSTASSSGGLLASAAAATKAAAEAAMTAMAATAESALTSGPTGMLLVPEESLTFNNHQRQFQMPACHPHQQQQQFVRQCSSNAASSFSMPSEGTATAAAALANLANAGPYYSSRPASGVLQYSPTNSQQEQQQQQQQSLSQQQQQQQQQQQEYQGPLMAPPPRVPSSWVPTSQAMPAQSPPPSFPWAGSNMGQMGQGPGQVGQVPGGCSSSKPPLPPTAQAVAAAALASGAEGALRGQPPSLTTPDP
jgi:DNA segregation ATPase FtsK/SpoIIIE-like protein